MRIVVLASLVLATSCAGDASGTPDCKGALYDPCQEEHDCDSGICRPFGDDVIVCTMACTPGDNSTCPAQGKDEVVCTEAAVCQPMVANACHLSIINGAPQ